MAGAAAKKTAKNAEVKTKYYVGVSAGSSLFHLVIRIGLYQGTDFGSLLLSAFLCLVSWLCLRMITSALELGVGYDLWQDLFIINTVVQLGILWSSYVWLLYLMVPGYGVYQLGGRVLEWIFTPKDSEQQAKNPKKKRREPEFVRRSI